MVLKLTTAHLGNSDLAGTRCCTGCHQVLLSCQRCPRGIGWALQSLWGSSDPQDTPLRWGWCSHGRLGSSSLRCTSLCSWPPTARDLPHSGQADKERSCLRWLRCRCLPRTASGQRHQVGTRTLLGRSAAGMTWPLQGSTPPPLPGIARYTCCWSCHAGPRIGQLDQEAVASCKDEGVGLQ